MLERRPLSRVRAVRGRVTRRPRVRADAPGSGRRVGRRPPAMSAASVAMAAHYGPERAGLLTDLWPHFAFGIWVHERERGSGPRGRLAWDLWAGGTAAAMLLAYGFARGRLGQEAKQVV